MNTTYRTLTTKQDARVSDEIANSTYKPYDGNQPIRLSASAETKFLSSPATTNVLLKAVAIVAAVAGIASGDDWPGDGKFIAGCTNNFYNGDAPFAMGEGMLLYTGDTAVVERDLTFTTTNGRPVTINIQNADTELVVTGKFQQTRGPMIKTGDGTLTLTYPGYQEFGKSKGSTSDAGTLMWDETTGACTNSGYTNWTLDKGRVIFGASGQTNVIQGTAWVGSWTDASPRMDVTGGVTRITSSYFTIGRGTGTTNSPQYPSVHVSSGGYLDIASLVLANQNNKPGVYSEPLLLVNGATARVAGDCFIGEQSPCKSSVVVTNSGLFQNDSWYSNNSRGMSVGQYVSPGNQALLDISHSSTGMTYSLDVTTYSTLNIHDGGTLIADISTPSFVTSGQNAGRILLDGATICPRRTAESSDWFTGTTNVQIGTRGLTVKTSGNAYLAGLAQPLAGTSGGTITKMGSGTLAMRPANVPVHVQEGTLRMTSATPFWTNSLVGSLVMDEGTSLAIAGDHALGGMSFTAGSTNVSFETQGLESQSGLWYFNGWAKPREDGILCLSDNYGGANGSAFLKRKVAVDQSFSLTFDYFGYTLSAIAADGISVIWQNGTNGVNALGGGSRNLGYTGITNSFAVGISCYDHRICFGEEGAYVATNTLSSALPYLLSKVNVRNHVHIDYDAVAHHITVTLTRPDVIGSYSYGYDVNIVELVGGTEAYFGFAGTSGGSWAQHCLSNIRLNPDNTARESVRHGGNLALGAGTFNAALTPSTSQRGFVLDQLKYTDGAVLNVEEDDSLVDAKLPVLTLARTNLWELLQYAHWLEPGVIAVSDTNRNNSGSVVSERAYPVSGSWTASFDYNIGEGSTPPADLISFVVHNEKRGTLTYTPGTGISVMWRYYDGSNRKTELKLYINGSMSSQSETNSIEPVDLVKNGPAKMKVSYDEGASTLTVQTVQGENTFTKEFTNIVMRTILRDSIHARIGFAAAVGWSFAQNMVSNFTFTSDAMTAGTSDSGETAYGYLGFDSMNGTGTLVKRGAGGLGLNGATASNVTLRLEEGSLLLRKENLEPVSLSPAGGWTFTGEGNWGPNGGLQVGDYFTNCKGTAQLKHRVRVDSAWHCSFNLTMQSRTQADALSFFLHNDPRGPYCCGGYYSGAGFSGIKNGFAWRVYFYPYNKDADSNTVSIGTSSSFPSSRQSMNPLTVLGKTTAVDLTYDPEAKTLVSVMIQANAGITNTFADVDIPTVVKDHYAYIGFGVGCGGVQTDPEFWNFKFETLTPQDTLTNEIYLKTLTLANVSTVAMETTVTNASFHLSDSVTMDADATLHAVSLGAGSTLRAGTVTQSGAATFDVDADSVLEIGQMVNATTNSIIKTGAGLLHFTGKTANVYRGPLVLNNGTVQLDAPVLPKADLLVNTANSPKLKLNFSEKQRIHSLVVDGKQMSGGRYTSANTSWIQGSGLLIVTWPPQGTVIMLM